MSNMLDNVKFSRLKRKVLSHPRAVRFGLIFLFLGSFVLGIFVLVKVVNMTKIPIFLRLASKFILAPSQEVSQEAGRTNILIMGRAGENYTGPELTDTMLVASVSFVEPSAKIISIPRDTWIPEARAKINSAYYYGKMPLSKSLTSEVLGLPIHYGVLIDFSGFTKIIDILGGVEVDVERTFTDDMYPIVGRENDTCGGGDPKYLCRYETVHFEAGKQVMDGATALKFVRSRRAEGDEGTDLAREARQQKLLGAVKDKILDPRLLIRPKMALAIYGVVISSIETDVNSDTAMVLARRLFDLRDNVETYLIPQDLLVNPPISKIYDNQYVFIPKLGNGKWDDIHKWVSEILE